MIWIWILLMLFETYQKLSTLEMGFLSQSSLLKVQKQGYTLLPLVLDFGFTADLFHCFTDFFGGSSHTFIACSVLSC